MRLVSGSWLESSFQRLTQVEFFLAPFLKLVNLNFILKHLIYLKLVFLPFFSPFLSIKLSRFYAHRYRVCGLTHNLFFVIELVPGSKPRLMQIDFFKNLFILISSFNIWFIGNWSLYPFFLFYFYWVIWILCLWSWGLRVNLSWLICFLFLFLN
jgi:hypothetical protein